MDVRIANLFRTFQIQPFKDLQEFPGSSNFDPASLAYSSGKEVSFVQGN